MQVNVSEQPATLKVKYSKKDIETQVKYHETIGTKK